MSETFNLNPPQTILCDDCNYDLPFGRIWFCPECSDNLCDKCNDSHKCDNQK